MAAKRKQTGQNQGNAKCHPPSTVGGLEMSSRQLTELWNFDALLAHDFLGMPLRSCSAKPCDWGREMPREEFEALKGNIRAMWIRAALIFSPFKEEGDVGWGLKVNKMCQKNLFLPKSSFTEIGWMAEAPQPGECPTAHRYLRSPIGNQSYLGGPISLANWSSSPTVECRNGVSSRSSHVIFVTTKQTLPVETPIVWNYEINIRDKSSLSLHSISEWQLTECCREVVFSPGSSCEEKPNTKRKYPSSVQRPSKILRLNISYRFCTYCGANIEENLEPMKKRNIKPHWAMTHTVQLCNEMHVPVDDENAGVVQKDFFRHLKKVEKVLQTLESHGYAVTPACHYLEKETLQDPHLSEDQKLHLFEAFKEEAKYVFNKYKVLQLKGMCVPRSFQDLLPVAETTYADVNWKDHTRPRSNTFSCNLDDDELESLRLEIEVTFQSILHDYMGK